MVNALENEGGNSHSFAIMVVVIVLILIVIGFWYTQKEPAGDSTETTTSESQSLGDALGTQTGNPIEETPDANPFQNEAVNPLEDVYKNPFE